MCIPQNLLSSPLLNLKFQSPKIDTLLTITIFTLTNTIFLSDFLKCFHFIRFYRL